MNYELRFLADNMANLEILGRTLEKWLKIDKNLSAYWLSPMAEHNPIKTAELRSITERHTGGGLRDFVISLCAVAQLAMRKAIVRIICGRPAKSFADGSRPIFVTYFPYLDREKAARGVFENKYFAPVQEGREIDWLLIFVKADGVNFLRAVLMARRFLRYGERMAFTESFVSIGWLAAQIVYVLMAAAAWALLLATKGIVASRGDVRSLVRRAMFGHAVTRAILHWFAFRTVFSRCVNPHAKCVYPAEMQSWETALNAAAHESGVRTFAYQHSPAARSRKLWQHGLWQMERMPLPDVVLCDGSEAAWRAASHGYKNVRLVESLRYGHLAEAHMRQGERTEKTLLAIGSIDPGETDSILWCLVGALPYIEGWRVFMKPHPSCPVSLPGQRIKAWHESLASALEMASVVFAGTSSAAAEALAYGCDVILLARHPYPLLNVLEGHEDLYRTAVDGTSLAGALKWNEKNGMSASAEAKREFVRSFWHFDGNLPLWQAVLDGKE